MESVTPTLTQEHYVVAIGASAGGLEAIHEFFDNMPEDGNFSFIIIQHLSPDYKSLLVELVSKHTKMKVFEAQHGTELMPNCVYVIPNDKLMRVKDGRLQLSNKLFDKSPNTAIDTFFKSLAEDQGAKAIAVILSGTGTDGSRGIEAIQQHGGMILVQDPMSAKFNGMPNSAIAGGYADFILSPDMMPEEILNYVKEKPSRMVLDGRPDEAALPELLKLVERNCGYDFHNYKTPTIIRRIMRRMNQLEQKKFSDYLDLLHGNSDECKILGKEFLIGVTKFFRDTVAFEIIEQEVLPEIVRHKEPSEVLKVWVTACSTGQEAYSLAILINEHLRRINKHIEIKIFATDVDMDAIEIASRGLYPGSSLADIDPDLVQRYFEKQGSHYSIVSSLRKQIVFARHNILKDPPFIKNDIVTCRNMLIYMNSVLQRKVLSTLQYSLNHGGCLFLGPSEIPTSISSTLAEVSNKWKIYRKIANERFYQPNYDTSNYLRSSREIKILKENAIAKELADDFKNTLTEEFKFAGIYVDRNYEVKEAVGDFRRYLSLPEKIVNLNILKMVGQDLSIALNAGLRKALKENHKVTLKHIRIAKEEQDQFIDIFIKPPKTIDGLVLMVFGESTEVNHTSTVSPVGVLPHSDPESATYTAELEEELKETRLNLQMAVESLETTNEELQSSNEELLSANEELQSSNEELQSLNEELHTLNSEHQLRIKELIELNDDLNNYFRSTEIGQVFVDMNMRIRKFNPAAVQLVNLIDSDVGRPIDHISTNIRDENLGRDIHVVISEKRNIEKEVELSNGRTSLMRILPYVRQDLKVDGAVITFIDITPIKELHQVINGVFNASLSAILAFKTIKNRKNEITDLICTASNHAADKLLGKANSAYMNQSALGSLPEIFTDEVFQKCIDVAEDDKPLHVEKLLEFGGIETWFEIVASKMRDGLVLTLTNINEKKRSEERLRKNYHELMRAKDNLKELNAKLEEKVESRTQELLEKNKALRLLIQEFEFVTDFMPQMVWSTKPNGDHDFFNKQWYNYTGLRFEELKDKGWATVVHPEDYRRTWVIWNNSLEEGSDYEIEYRLRRQDGEYRWFLGRALPLKDEEGKVVKWFGTCTDIHDQKLMNDILEQKVRERTVELENTNTELMQFASVASHDLKEPLRKIHMFANILKDRYLKDIDGAMDYMIRIINSSARMTKLINDLLTFSRLSVSQLFEPVDLNNVFADVLSDLELFIQEKNAKIEIGKLPQLDGTPGQLRQVFQNIVSNSLKFTAPGVTPQITIRSEYIDSLNINAPAVVQGNYCRITMKDNGIGFDPQYASKIFTIFQRLHARERYDGTGIGLAITKKIVDRHNGLVTAQSEEGKGSTFTIILPLKQMYQEPTLVQT